MALISYTNIQIDKTDAAGDGFTASRSGKCVVYF